MLHCFGRTKQRLPVGELTRRYRDILENHPAGSGGIIYGATAVFLNGRWGSTGTCGWIMNSKKKEAAASFFISSVHSLVFSVRFFVLWWHSIRPAHFLNYGCPTFSSAMRQSRCGSRLHNAHTGSGFPQSLQCWPHRSFHSAECFCASLICHPRYSVSLHPSTITKWGRAEGPLPAHPLPHWWPYQFFHQLFSHASNPPSRYPAFYQNPPSPNVPGFLLPYRVPLPVSWVLSNGSSAPAHSAKRPSSPMKMEPGIKPSVNCVAGRVSSTSMSSSTNFFAADESGVKPVSLMASGCHYPVYWYGHWWQNNGGFRKSFCYCFNKSSLVGRLQGHGVFFFTDGAVCIRT